MVLLHEFAHIRRHDLPITVLAQLVCALYWPNPAVWAARRMARVREQACDETVLRAGADRLRYAENLLAIARALLPANRSSLAMSDSCPLRVRIRALLETEPLPDSPTARCKACSAALASLIIVPLAAAALVEGPPATPVNTEADTAFEDTNCDP